jgi:hypothetical protein
MSIDRWDPGYDHWPDELDPEGEWVRYGDHLKAVASMQARIDELMLEYCPAEMTKEQLDEWAKHQVAVELPDETRWLPTDAGRKHLEGGK